MMQVLLRENEDDPWIEQVVVYRDGKVWFQVDKEFYRNTSIE